MSSTKGSRVERELVNLLRDLGFKIMRAPSSGAATSRDLPDVLAGNGDGLLIAMEVKAWAEGTHYFSEEEVAALQSFASGFHPHCIPLLVTRWNRDTHFYLARPDAEALHRTDSGNVRAKKQVCQAEWEALEDYVSRNWEGLREHQHGQSHSPV